MAEKRQKDKHQRGPEYRLRWHVNFHFGPLSIFIARACMRPLAESVSISKLDLRAAETTVAARQTAG
jgi:hypothetical protein